MKLFWKAMKSNKNGTQVETQNTSEGNTSLKRQRMRMGEVRRKRRDKASSWRTSM